MEAARSQHEVTHLLRPWSPGGRSALAKFTLLVYRELHRAGRRYMARQQPDQTPQATALVNEVYILLIAFRQVSREDRAHSLLVCTQLMRRILTDWARRQACLKRGTGARHIPFEEVLVLSSEHSPDLVALDQALKVLERVVRDWRIAKLWLSREMTGGTRVGA